MTSNNIVTRAITKNSGLVVVMETAHHFLAHSKEDYQAATFRTSEGDGGIVHYYAHIHFYRTKEEAERAIANWPGSDQPELLTQTMFDSLKRGPYA